MCAAALLAHVRRGDTVWNVGANVGVYTLQLAHMVGDTGRVVAFEPNPRTIAVLRRNVALNGYEDRVLVEAHVGYPFIDGAHRLLAATRDARLKGESYDAAGWQVAVELPSAEAEGFRVALRELTRGSATVEEHEVEL